MGKREKTEIVHSISILGIRYSLFYICDFKHIPLCVSVCVCVCVCVCAGVRVPDV